MPETLSVKLCRPIRSARILDETNQASFSSRSPSAAGTTELCGGEGANNESGTEQNLNHGLELQKNTISQVCRALNEATTKLNELCDKIFAEHSEAIAKLSVEIARKILAQKVAKGDYVIEGIIEEALKNAPTRQDVVVHLNPEDLVECQKTQQDEPAGALAGIKFVPDPNIRRAECIVETQKGIVQSLIDEHLERIAKALKKVE